MSYPKSPAAQRWRRFVARALFWPTLGWNVLLGRILKLRHWWDEMDDQIVLGARPFARDVPILARLGVTGIVNTCEEFAGHPDQYRRLGMEQLWIPTVDFTHPSRSDVDAAIRFMRQQLERGGKVYVHCKAGRARSATVVLCYLISQRQMPASEAQSLLLQRRPHINRSLTTRPVVAEFEADRIAGNSPPSDQAKSTD